MEYPGTEVARFLGMRISSVSRMARLEEMEELVLDLKKIGVRRKKYTPSSRELLTVLQDLYCRERE